MSNKQKHIDSAQKNIKKKLFSRAIKDFQKVVEIDPRDIRYRQRLAELYVKTNKAGEAFEQYEAVAKFFSSNGFYLKAIAIYKQMQRLDSSQISIFSRLAELNEKQGLIGNALAELRHLVGYYEKNDMVADSIKTLEKMRDLDVGNINVQVKLAEVYAKNERIDDGLVELKSLLKQLEAKHDHDKILRLYRMFLPLFPQNDDLQRGLAESLIGQGDSVKGIAILQSLLRNRSDDVELLSLLGGTYAKLEDFKNARFTYLHMLRIEPTDLESRECLVQCYLNEETFDKALAELEDWKDAFLKINRLEKLQEFYEALQAVMPDNHQVLQTLDSIYEITGDGDKLLTIVTGSSFSGVETPAVNEISEETLSDSLLGEMDDDGQSFGDSDLLGTSFASEIPLEEDGVELELELEPLEEEIEEDDEFIELNLADAPKIESEEASDEMSLDFDLDDDDDVDQQYDISADLEEAEFYLQQGLFEDAEKVCNSILGLSPDNKEVKAKLEEISSRREAQEGQGDTSSELQDLAAELLEDGFPELETSFNDDTDVLSPGSPDKLSPVESVADKSKVFRTDVDEQIAADDMESHYNLGIAYREMGLFSDAVAEFGKAERDPARFVDCQTLKGLCSVDQGDFEKGEESFQAALKGDSLADGQKLSLHYELATLYESWERPLDALDHFQLVADTDLYFRDVADRLDKLRRSLGLTDDPGNPSSPDVGHEPEETKDRISFL